MAFFTKLQSLCRISPIIIRCTSRLLSTELSVVEEGKSLKLVSPGITYDGKWLRHNCRCSQCYDRQSSMNRVHYLKLAQDIKIESAQIKGDTVVIKWSSDSVGNHEGEFPKEWLYNFKSNVYLEQQRNATKPLIASSLPSISFSDLTNTDEGTYQWLKQLNYYGISFIPDAGTDPSQLKKISSKFPHAQLTVFDTPEEFSSLPAHLTDDITSDVAYSTEELYHHQDLMYYESPPGIMLFHSIRNDSCVEGGENEFVDLYQVALRLKETEPKLFDVFTKVPVTFTKANYTTNDYEYKSYLSVTRPHIQLDRFGEIGSINWSPQHQEPLQLDNQELLDQYYSAFIAFSNLLEKFKITHLMEPGQIMSFNNRRFSHSRKSFRLNGGARQFNFVYYNIDYLRSQFVVLGKALNKTDPPKNIFLYSL